MADHRMGNSPGKAARGPTPLGRMHAVVSFSALPLFLGALLSDWAYASSYQVQWTNFADWLNAAGLSLAVIALLWAALAELGTQGPQEGHRWLHVVILAISVILAFVNALVHAKDGWAAMPAAPVLSSLVVLTTAVASVIGLARFGRDFQA